MQYFYTHSLLKSHTIYGFGTPIAERAHTDLLGKRADYDIFSDISHSRGITLM